MATSTIEDLGTMARGELRYVDLVVTDETGAALDLTGRTLVLTAKWDVGDADSAKVFQLTSGSGITHATQSGATQGHATATIAAALTKDLDISRFGRTLYLDSWVRDVPNRGGRYKIKIEKPVTLTLP